MMQRFWAKTMACEQQQLGDAELDKCKADGESDKALSRFYYGEKDVSRPGVAAVLESLAFKHLRLAKGNDHEQEQDGASDTHTALSKSAPNSSASAGKLVIDSAASRQKVLELTDRQVDRARPISAAIAYAHRRWNEQQH